MPPVETLAKPGEELRRRLSKAFEGMMKALFKEKGSQLRVEILADPAVQEFVGAHAGVLDSTFEKVGMSDATRRLLTRSDYIFSGMKAFHELHEAFPSLLDENGNRKPFERFLNDVRKIDQTYNANYLRAEYNFVARSAQMAARWESFQEDGDRYNLQYRTQRDDRVRPEHAPLDRVTLPMSDPFWKEYFPPNGWNCFTGGTPVLTTSGWKRIKEVRRGDLVVGGSGKLREVIGTHAKTVDEELVRVLAKGGIATCTKNHRFCTSRGWVAASDLQPGDIIVQVGKNTAFHKVVNAIKNAATLLCYGGVTLVGDRKPAPALTVDDKIEGRDVEIDDIPSYEESLLEWKGFCRQVGGHDFLGLAQWLSQCAHSCRMLQTGRLTRHFAFLDHLFPAEGGGDGELLRNLSHKLAVGLGLALADVSSLKRELVVGLRKFLACFKPPLRRVDPLGPDRRATLAGLDTALGEHPEHGAEVDVPMGREPSDAPLLRDIPLLRGIRDIHAFDGFNSAFDFVRKTFLHDRYIVVEGKVTIKKSETKVYNLSVAGDESYVVPVGIVHNCRCQVVQVLKSKYPVTPHEEAMRLGREALRRDTRGIFRFNPGMERKTLPDYNPYTIRDCRTCDVAKGKVKLARFIPDNEVCAACRLVHLCEKLRGEIIKHGNGTIEVSDLVDRKDSDYPRLMQVAEFFAKDGAYVLLSPKMTRPAKFDYDCVYGSLKDTPYYGKCPDLKIGDFWYEHEGFTTSNPKRAFSNMVNHGLRQSDRIIIDKPDLTDAYMKRVIHQRIKDGHLITEVWLKEGQSLRLLYKKSEE